MKTKYFEYEAVFNRWIWENHIASIIVSEEGIEIEAKDTTSWSNPELLEEAVTIYKAYRNGTRI